MMIRPPAPWMIALLLALTAGGARADSVRIHHQASAQGPDVTLADIARLDGGYAQKLADIPVVQFPPGGGTLTLKLSQVRAALSERGVNWGRLSLSGFTTCRVTGAAPASSPTPATDTSHTKAATASPVATAALRKQVLKLIQRLADDTPDHLAVTFSDRDARRIDAATAGGRYEVRSMSTTGIGRVPMTISRYVGEKVTDTFSINPRVRRRIEAVIVTDTISRGKHFTEANTKLKQVLLDTDRGKPVTDPDAVQGQVAGALLRSGAVIYPDDVAPPVLVKRGQLVTVHAIVGQMVIRTVARATEDGTRGQKVTLRNQKTRETFTATVTGPRQTGI